MRKYALGALVVLVFVATALVLSGCSSSVTKERPAPQPTEERNGTYQIVKIRLSDGRSLTCVDLWDTKDCDWANAK